MSKTADRAKPGEDRDRFEAMSAGTRRAAAIADPDAKPLASEDFKRMRRTPQIKIVRRALGPSQEEFSARLHIPVGALRDSEQGRKEPDPAARAYLAVIGRRHRGAEDEVIEAARRPPALLRAPLPPRPVECVRDSLSWSRVYPHP